jgi:hypothetical protein
MENLTPMLRQYFEIKKQYPGTLLFFRLGDFYELFNEDAVIGSRELEIAFDRPAQRIKKPSSDVRRSAPFGERLYFKACQKRLQSRNLRTNRRRCQRNKTG